MWPRINQCLSIVVCLAKMDNNHGNNDYVHVWCAVLKMHGNVHTYVNPVLVSLTYRIKLSITDDENSNPHCTITRLQCTLITTHCYWSLWTVAHAASG